MFDFAIAGVQAPIFLLVLVGLTVGIVGGFIGVGGGYMVTPALIVFGFPGYMAAGIDMTHIAGKGLVSTVRHRQLGNIDWTLALSMIAGTMLGVELGVRLLVYFKHLGISGVVLLVTSVALMFTLFLYTQIETHRAHKKMEEMEKEGKQVGRELQTSNLPRLFQAIPLAPIVRCRTARVIVSMWVIVLVGMVTGQSVQWLSLAAVMLTLGEMIFLCLFISSLVWFAVRRRGGKWVPDWVGPLVI